MRKDINITPKFFSTYFLTIMVKKVVITGSEGLIGKILMNNLNEYELYGIDRIDIIRERYYRADLSDYAHLKKIFDKIDGIDVIIHLAADKRLNATWESILKNNIIATRNIYEIANIFKIPKVIFASSNHVTGGYEKIEGIYDGKIKIMPSLHIRPDSYYATSKVFGEAIARQFYEIYGISSICLRLGSVTEDDDPTKSERLAATWLSHRDLIQLFKKSIEADVKFGIYYGVSNNDRSFWSISNAKKDLGYEPIDNAFMIKKA